MDAEQIRALVEASSKAAVEAAMATVQGMNISKRKPDLPDFDVRNIEIWIKRVFRDGCAFGSLKMTTTDHSTRKWNNPHE